MKVIGDRLCEGRVPSSRSLICMSKSFLALPKFFTAKEPCKMRGMREDE